MMAQLDAAAAMGGVEPPAPDKPAAGADPAKPAEPADPDDPGAQKLDGEHDPLKPVERVKPAAAKPAEPGKPAKPEGEMSVEEMEKFLKAHSNKKPWKVYESLKTTTAQKVAELEGKLAALEKKPVEAPGDAAKMAALEKQIESLTGETKTYKQKLAAADFRHTDTYANLTNKANRLFQQAVAVVSTLQITNADGTVRAATAQDLDRLRRMDPADREDKLEELFGPKARVVARYTDALDAIRAEANDAEEDFAKTNEQTTLQRELEAKGNQSKFEARFKSSLDELRANPVYGKWFAPDPADPEGSKLLTDGFAEIDKVLKAEGLSPEDAAAYAAVFQARAAAMPRMILEHNRQKAKITALEAELAQYRGTDPGAKGATGGGGGPAGAAKARGIEGAAMAFDSDPNGR